MKSNGDIKEDSKSNMEDNQSDLHTSLGEGDGGNNNHVEDGNSEDKGRSDGDSGTIAAFTEEINKLRKELEEKDKKHAEEIKQIVQSIRPGERKKTDFEISVEETVRKVNKYRGGFNTNGSNT